MRNCVITLGTFDGVHRGHRALLGRVVERARKRKARAVVLAFGMPPRHVAEKGSKSVLLTTLSEKSALMKALGIDAVEVLTFDRKTASTPPERFFRKTILERFGSKEMVVGPRVAFGKNRAGRLPLLKKLGTDADVRIHVIGSIGRGAKAVSSRRIRALLERGDVDNAQRLLGYPYSAEGVVVHGDRRGRTLGFPTANISIDPAKILPPGVFWVKILPAKAGYPFTPTMLRKAVDGLCNVGTRPTFTPGERHLSCEVYLLRGSKTLYGRRLRVVFLRKIRSEMRFSSGKALGRQIHKDVSLAKSWITKSRGNFFTK